MYCTVGVSHNMWGNDLVGHGVQCNFAFLY